MTNSGKAHPTPPKDLDEILDFHCWSLDKTKDENREHIAGLKAALLAWSDRRTLAIIGEDETGAWTGEYQTERDGRINGRNALRTEQRKALEADGGGDGDSK